MKLYCITSSLDIARRALQAGVDMVQIRAKELSARQLAGLVRQVIALGDAGRVLVNTRMDIALAYRAGGVHLPADSIAPARIRKLTPAGFRIGVSCHTVEELQRAEAEGADFGVYGPVFVTGDKLPIGLAAFEAGARSVGIPVYALGGVRRENAASCIEAGAEGVAGISFFE